MRRPISTSAASELGRTSLGMSLARASAHARDARSRTDSSLHVGLPKAVLHVRVRRMFLTSNAFNVSLPNRSLPLLLFAATRRRCLASLCPAVRRSARFVRPAHPLAPRLRFVPAG
eukprot:5893246-Pleurochrysis_carterae.AAC.3